MDTWDFVMSREDSLHKALTRAPLDFRTFCEWASEVIETHGTTKANVVQKSCLNPTFAYQILSGQRRATRDKLLQLAFGMELDIAQTTDLLERGGSNGLSPRNPRDVAIAWCIARNMSVPACDEVLFRAGMDPLRKGYPNIRA